VVNRVDPSGECDPIICGLIILAVGFLVGGCTTTGSSSQTSFEQAVTSACNTNGGCSNAISQLSTELDNLLQNNQNLFSIIADYPLNNISYSVEDMPERPGDVRLAVTSCCAQGMRLTTYTPLYQRVADGRISEQEFIAILAKEHQHVYDHSHKRDGDEDSIILALDLGISESRGYYVAFAYLEQQGIRVNSNSGYPIDAMIAAYGDNGACLGFTWTNPQANPPDAGPCYYDFDGLGVPACR
jgi:hypothetical protein